ncbi:hypothetical protein VTO73DRAFT_415 [Trametes versicolor]
MQGGDTFSLVLMVCSFVSRREAWGFSLKRDPVRATTSRLGGCYTQAGHQPKLNERISEVRACSQCTRQLRSHRGLHDQSSPAPIWTTRAFRRALEARRPSQTLAAPRPRGLLVHPARPITTGRRARGPRGFSGRAHWHEADERRPQQHPHTLVSILRRRICAQMAADLVPAGRASTSVKCWHHRTRIHDLDQHASSYISLSPQPPLRIGARTKPYAIGCARARSADPLQAVLARAALY